MARPYSYLLLSLRRTSSVFSTKENRPYEIEIVRDCVWRQEGAQNNEWPTNNIHNERERKDDEVEECCNKIVMK